MLLLLSALVLGLSGSLHCIGMCGPLVMRLPFAQSKNQLVSVLFYHIGKAITYGALGMTAGLLGKGFTMIKWQQGLSILAGVFLLAITFFPVLKNRFSSGSMVSKLFQQLQQSMLSKNGPVYFILFGMINGLLPCGLVYAALAGAMVSGSVLSGAMFMVLFGLGTIPSLSALIYFKNKISLSAQRVFSRSTFYISLIVGILLVVRGMNLGIPYVSPSFDPVKKEMNCCHRS